VNDDDIRSCINMGHAIHAARFVQQGFAFHDQQALGRCLWPSTRIHVTTATCSTEIITRTPAPNPSQSPGRRTTPGVPDGKVIKATHSAFKRSLDLPPVKRMQDHGVCRRLLGFCQKFFDVDRLFLFQHYGPPGYVDIGLTDDKMPVRASDRVTQPCH
jgi:hypothetical protein